MNIKIETIGGGIFSKFMIAVQSILHNVENINQIKNIYIDINRDKICTIRNKNITINPFDYVLEQNPNLVFDKIIDSEISHKKRYEKYGSQVYTDINKNLDLPKLKKICTKIKIKNNILNMVNSNIDKNTLGVHVRLTDMNLTHKNFGVGTTQKYIETINKIKKYNNIFIASDNINSIESIKKKFDIIYNNTSNRCINENGYGYTEYLRNNSSEKNLWVDSFLEMLSLSKCGKLIYKVSNLNNVSVVFSNTIKKTYRI